MGNRTRAAQQARRTASRPPINPLLIVATDLIVATTNFSTEARQGYGRIFVHAIKQRWPCCLCRLPVSKDRIPLALYSNSDTEMAPVCSSCADQSLIRRDLKARCIAAVNRMPASNPPVVFSAHLGITDTVTDADDLEALMARNIERAMALPMHEHMANWRARVAPEGVPVVSTQRACDDCTACCTAVAVSELDKPAGVTCQHVCGGCAIYDSRPKSCATWSCFWLYGADVGQRPDLSKLVISSSPGMLHVATPHGGPSNIATLQVWCDPQHPDAHLDPAFRQWLNRALVPAQIRYEHSNTLTGFFLFPPSVLIRPGWMTCPHDKIAPDGDRLQLDLRHAQWELLPMVGTP